jgi:hypothetical protein
VQENRESKSHTCIRQHTSAYVNIRQHTSAYVSIRQHTSTYVSIRQHASAYVSTHAAAREYRMQPCNSHRLQEASALLQHTATHFVQQTARAKRLAAIAAAAVAYCNRLPGHLDTWSKHRDRAPQTWKTREVETEALSPP